MPEQDPARRAVVTGLGAVMPIGNDFPTYWSNLVAGRDRDAARSRRFDASASEVRIAAEVNDFDPTTVDGRQDGPPHEPLHPFRDGAPARRPSPTPGSTSRRWTQEQRDRVGVVVNTGGGGIEQIIDGTHVHDAKGPGFVSPVRGPGAVGLDGRLHALDGVRPHRPGHHPGRRLRDVGHRVPRRAPPDPRRRVRRRPGRRLGGAALADGLRRAREHDRAVEAQRRPGDGVAAVRPDPRRVRLRRGRRRRRRRVAAHALARGATIHRRDRRRRADRRRLPHLRPGADRPRPDAGHDAGAAAMPASRRTRSTTSSPTAPRPSSTTRPRRRRSRRAYGEHAYKVAISSPKSMIGHLLGAAGIASALAADRGDPRRGHPADDQPPRRPTPTATSTTSRYRARRRRSRRRRSTASASAARTRSRSSAASRLTGPSPSGAKRAALERLDRRRQ